MEKEDIRVIKQYFYENVQIYDRPMENLPPAIMYNHRICRLNPNQKRG